LKQVLLVFGDVAWKQLFGSYSIIMRFPVMKILGTSQHFLLEIFGTSITLHVQLQVYHETWHLR